MPKSKAKPSDRTIVTSASVINVKNEKRKRKSHATFDSDNRISKKVTNDGNIKRKSATLQDDGSLVIAVNTFKNPAGRTRMVRNKKRAVRKLDRLKSRFNKQQDRFIDKIS
jgi:hypothetical protein